MMSGGAGGDVDIPIRQSNPAPRDLAEARRQYAETLARLDRYEASPQAKQQARAAVDSIYASYLDPDRYGVVATQPPTVDLGPASLPISAFADAAHAPGAEQLSRIAEELGTYVELFPKSRINEAATLLGIMAGEAIGGLYKPAAAERAGGGATNRRTYSGGAYGRLSAEKGVIERHHAPADSVSLYTTYSGPAIQMDYADHLLTSSHGSQGISGQLYRAEVRQMIDSGNVRGAMANEIWDIRRVSVQSSGSTTKYNVATREMLDYAYGKGYLKKVP